MVWTWAAAVRVWLATMQLFFWFGEDDVAVKIGDAKQFGGAAAEGTGGARGSGLGVAALPALGEEVAGWAGGLRLGGCHR